MPTLPTATARLVAETAGRSRTYIEEEPGKKVETYVRWRQQQAERRQEREQESRVEADQETSHLAELQHQIEEEQRRSTSLDTTADSVDNTAAATEVLSAAEIREHSTASGYERVKKKDKRSSISQILNVFTRKKSGSLKKKKASLTDMMEKEAERKGSLLDPAAQQRIIESQTRAGAVASESPEPGRARSPYQEWRQYRELNLSRTSTPDPDYDNLSAKSVSPRAPRLRSPSQQEDAGSDTSSEYGRHTPRSLASEYGRNIPRYQPTPSLFAGFGRGSPSPAPSQAPSRSPSQAPSRSPSTDSFFGKNGAMVGQAGSSQIWYQKYKHSSFSHQNQPTFGETPYGAFDGRISKFRGKLERKKCKATNSKWDLTLGFVNGMEIYQVFHVSSVSFPEWCFRSFHL